MTKILEFKKSTIKLNNKVILNNFDFVVEKNVNTAIIGTNASGKSTILKALAGVATCNNLYINGNYCKNKNDLYKAVGVVFNNTALLGESVKNELTFPLCNLNLDSKIIDEKVDYIIDYFNFQEYLEYDPTLLPSNLKILLKIISFLIFEPEILAIDDLFIFLDKSQKNQVINFAKEKNITLVLVTCDIENTIYTDYIYVLASGSVIAEGLRDSIYKEEKLLNRIGLGLPFMIDLSTQLMHYELIDKFYFDKEDLVGELWK